MIACIIVGIVAFILGAFAGVSLMCILAFAWSHEPIVKYPEDE